MLLLTLVSCGYRSPHDPSGGAGGWCVRAGTEPSAHPDATSAAVSGARDVFARSGGLVPCSEGERFVVRVMQVTLDPAGIVLDGSLRSRGTRVRVTVAADPVGSVTEEEVVATTSRPIEEAQAHRVAVERAARRAGGRLAELRLGGPSPSRKP